MSGTLGTALMCDIALSASRKSEASGVSEGGEEYAGMGGLGMTAASLGIGTRDTSRGIAEPELELALLEVWCVNGAGTG